MQISDSVWLQLCETLPEKIEVLRVISRVIVYLGRYYDSVHENAR